MILLEIKDTSLNDNMSLNIKKEGESDQVEETAKQLNLYFAQQLTP